MEFKNRMELKCACGHKWEETVEGGVELIYTEFGVIELVFSASYQCPECKKTTHAKGSYGPLAPVAGDGGNLKVERIETN